MALVLDCSVTLPWYLEDEKHQFAELLLDRVGEVEMWVPALWRLEFANALLMAERRRRIDQKRRLQILGQALRLPIKVDNELPDIVGLSDLAKRTRLTIYDATYLELAQRRNFALATMDKELIVAARTAQVRNYAAQVGADLSRRAQRPRGKR